MPFPSMAAAASFAALVIGAAMATFATHPANASEVPMYPSSVNLCQYSTNRAVRLLLTMVRIASCPLGDRTPPARLGRYRHR